jgi:hypothetical protein
MDAYAMHRCQLPQVKQVKNAIIVGSETRLPVGGALNDVRGDIGNQDSRLARHVHGTPFGPAWLTFGA